MLSDSDADHCVDACPSCDTTRIAPRSQRPGPPRDNDPSAAYRCLRCGATFDDPNQRAAKAPGPSADAILDRALAEGDDE